MISVNSSHISAVEYDEGAGVLKVEFKDGALYSYAHVPPELWDSLSRVIREDDSVGRWLHANIRAFPSMYPYQRLK